MIILSLDKKLSWILLLVIFIKIKHHTILFLPGKLNPNHILLITLFDNDNQCLPNKTIMYSATTLFQYYLSK